MNHPSRLARRIGAVLLLSFLAGLTVQFFIWSLYPLGVGTFVLGLFLFIALAEVFVTDTLRGRDDFHLPPR